MRDASDSARLLSDVVADDLVDISIPITTDMVTWDDRFPPTVEWHSATARGDRTTNSTWTLNAHTGTHVDAPLHHLKGGGDVGSLQLSSHIGRCRVLDLTDVQDEIEPVHLEPHDVRPGDRLLLKTRNSVHQESSEQPRFHQGFVALSEESARWLVDRRVGLVGTDGLGIEPYGRRDGAVHRLLLGADVVVLEGLRLSQATAGDYVLIFLPVLLTSAEAAPGRAVLLRLGSTD